MCQLAPILKTKHFPFTRRFILFPHSSESFHVLPLFMLNRSIVPHFPFISFVAFFPFSFSVSHFSLSEDLAFNSLLPYQND